MKKYLKIFIMALAILSLAACAHSETTTSSDNSVSSPPDDSQFTVIENDFDLPYKLYVSAEKASDVLNFKKIDFPAEIDGLTPQICGFIDSERIWICLYENTDENGYVAKSLGRYNISTNEYDMRYRTEDGEDIKFECANGEFVVFRSTTDNWKTVKLYLFSADTTAKSSIFTYSKISDGTTYMSGNNICIHDNKVYFDNIKQSEDALQADLYCYDILHNTNKLIMENAQNPFLYKGDVACITQNADGEYKSFAFVDGEKILETDMALMGMSASSNDIFAIENFYTNDTEAYTIQRLVNMENETPILKTQETISDVVSGSVFTAFSNYGFTYPCLYDIVNDRVLVFDDLREAEHTFFLKDDYGIIVTYYGEETYESPEYHFFSLENPNNNDSLQMFTIVQNGDVIGEECVDTADISTVRNKNPWTGETKFDALPVYKNIAVEADYKGPDSANITAHIERCLGREFFSVKKQFESVVVNFVPALEIPDEYKVFSTGTYTKKEWDARSDYVLKTYGKLLNMENPKPTYAASGSIEFYNASGSDLQQMMNYSFDRAAVYYDDDGNISKILFKISDLSEKLGDYPAITVDEAKQLFAEGHYFATCFPTDSLPAAEDIAAVELIYRTPHTAYFGESTQKYFVPYYCFYVDMHFSHEGAERYGMYYVPAINGKYISNMP